MAAVVLMWSWKLKKICVFFGRYNDGFDPLVNYGINLVTFLLCKPSKSKVEMGVLNLGNYSIKTFDWIITKICRSCFQWFEKSSYVTTGGAPSRQVTDSFDQVVGIKIHETNPILRCEEFVEIWGFVVDVGWLSVNNGWQLCSKIPRPVALCLLVKSSFKPRSCHFPLPIFNRRFGHPGLGF